MRHFILCLLLSLPASAATTYYIDYNAANDSANGTSTSTPWKRHPYMVGWAGSYVHTVGDRFIFKGGVTWPRVCFQLNITTGGSGTTLDYYGVDAAWFTGGSWSRPIFDFEHNVIGTFSAGAGVLIADVGNIMIDNLDLKNHQTVLAPNNQQSATIQTLNACSNVYVINSYIHDWDQNVHAVAMGDQGNAGGISYVGSGVQGTLMVSNCNFNQSGVTQRCGTPIAGFYSVMFNTISNTGTGYLGGGTIHNNHIHHIQSPNDTEQHANGILTQSGASTIFSNRLHDLAAESTTIYCDTGLGGGTGTNLVYANYLGLHSTQVPFQVGVGVNCGARVFNNTIIGGTCVRVSDSGSSGLALGHLELRNNWFVTSAAVVLIDTSVTTTIANYNLTNSIASANGYGAVDGNFYQPTSAGSPTIDTGTNLLSYFTRSLPFDVGAEEYFFGPPRRVPQRKDDPQRLDHDKVNKAKGEL